jgi:hypothetical protein
MSVLLLPGTWVLIVHLAGGWLGWRGFNKLLGSHRNILQLERKGDEK